MPREEILEVVSESSPDCILPDIHLPGLNGFQVLELIKTTISVPVILITGRPSASITSRANSGTATALLEKPIERDRLVNAIERAIIEASV